MENYNLLTYRRQFLLGSNNIQTPEKWTKTKVGKDFYLIAHPDLSVIQIDSYNVQLTLIGYIIDPFNPKSTNDEILKKICDSVNSFDELCSATYNLSGRWILIYANSSTIQLLNDPCGMRQVYYYYKDKQIWCGSQPNIIADELGLEKNNGEDIMKFISSSYYENHERAWVGNESIIKNVKHLLPNNSLNLQTAEVKRFWIDQENKDVTHTECVETVASILRGSLIAANERFNMNLAVTAGWDSRVLLAASKEIKNDIYYFVSTMNKLTRKDADIYVPINLSNKLKFKLNIIEDLAIVEESFKLILNKNVSMARDLPKTKTIFYAYKNFKDKININGNASEIARCYFEEKRPLGKINGYNLAKLEGYENIPYAVSQLNDWLESVQSSCEKNKIDILDLFYWEQRMGNWGSMYQAEQDIAMEEFCPFNNRKLLITLLRIDKKYRQAPNHLIYKTIINELWSDALSEPINPLNYKNKIKKKVLNFLPYSVKNRMKSFMR